MSTIKSLFLILIFAFSTATLLAQGPGSAKLKYDNFKTSGSGLDEAKKVIDEVINDEKHKEKPQTWLYYGLIYTAIASDQTGLFIELDKDPVQKAYDAFKKAQELDVKKRTHYKEATEEIAKLYPVALNYAIYHYNEQNSEAALKNFKLASELNPKDPIAAIYAAQMAYDIEQFGEYEKLMEKVLAIPTSAFDEYNSKVEKEEQKQDKGKFYYYFANHYIQKARQAEGDNETIKLKKKALEIAERGLKESPQNADLQKTRASLIAEVGNIDDAIKEMEAMASKNPEDAVTLSTLAGLYEQKGNIEKAFATYKKAIEQDADNFNANNGLAIMLYNQGVEVNKKILEDYDVFDEKNKELVALRNERDSFFKQSIPYFWKTNELSSPGGFVAKVAGEAKAKQFKIQCLYNLLRAHTVLLEKDKNNQEYKDKKKEIEAELSRIDPEFESGD